jgi:protein involved in polysaccharide export with SLBB domain
MFRRLILGALLVLASLISVQTQAQTDPIRRPRRTQSSPAQTETNNRQASSPEANAEAKRLYKVGVKHGEAGRFSEAAQTFEQVVKLKPDYADAYLSLGHAYYDLHQWDKAVDILEKGLALNPDDKVSRLRLAHAQRMLSQKATDRNKTRPDASGVDKAIGSTTSWREPEPSGASSKTSASDEDLTKIYRVGPGDVLDVRLTESISSESTLFTITPAGLLEHPDLSAPLPSNGLTVEEIAARIEEDLKKRPAIKNQKVSVAVQEYISHTILVSGLVKEPGTKSFKREGIPLYVVVADAQPLPEAGRVSVQRNKSNENFMVDLLDTSAMNMLVHPADVITILESQDQFFYVGGRVKSPGEKTLRHGLTLTQAIIAAGGLSKSSKEAQLARDNGKGFLVVTRYKLKEIESGKVSDPVIRPGDRITIID